MAPLLIVLRLSFVTDNFDRQMKRYWEEFGIEQSKVVRIQARLAAEDLMRITAPKTFKQGRNAVVRAICRAVNIIDPDSIGNPFFRQAVLDRDYDTVEAVMK